MKNKILLAVLILFIFTVPSCAELSGLTLCKIKQNGEPYATPLGRVPDPFADMIANPNSQAWTVCANVVGLWNYRDRYLKNIDDVKASDIINRTVEISDLMLQNNYNQNDRSEERYFHFLSEINSALCAQTGTCNGKKKTKWGPNGYLVVIRDDNKQPQN
ncbi:MAG: hypothetical protein J5601_06220, partial [Elusimicrobiaceae bacterium]|nr:hypothetical protein [Elusimicrobiaceae bacterium]